jgi:hypothetical protein
MQGTVADSFLSLTAQLFGVPLEDLCSSERTQVPLLITNGLAVIESGNNGMTIRKRASDLPFILLTLFLMKSPI